MTLKEFFKGFIFNTWSHSPLVSNAFSFVFFPCLGVFPVFCSVSVSLDFFRVFALQSNYLLPFTWPFLPLCRWVPGLGLALVSTNLLCQRQSRDAHGAEISIQISALTGFWILDLLLCSPARNR